MKSKKATLKALEMVFISKKDIKSGICNRPSCKNKRTGNSLYCSKECYETCHLEYK
jgi:hypothetical protein